MAWHARAALSLAFGLREDADEARDVFNRDFYGSVLLRAEDGAGAALTARLERDRALQVRVLPETAYYREQTKSAGPIQFLGGFLAAHLRGPFRLPGSQAQHGDGDLFL